MTLAADWSFKTSLSLSLSLPPSLSLVRFLCLWLTGFKKMFLKEHAPVCSALEQHANADRQKRMPQCTVLFILFNKLPLQNSQQLSPSSFTIRKSMYKSAACSETCIRSCHTKVVLNRTQTRSIRKQDYFQFHTKRLFLLLCANNI